MNSLKPEVSVIMATYNRAHLIGETLLSIQNQTFANWECLIIDDGSTDNTKEILEPFLDKEPRFKYLKRRPKYSKGPSGSRNMGLDIAKGKFIVFFDSDDIINPRTLEICLTLLESSSNKFINYSKKPFKNKWNGNFLNIEKAIKTCEIDINSIYDIVTQRIGFACCTIMWKKEVLETGRFNEDLTYAEEWEFYIRLMTSDIKGISIDNILYHNRKHPNSNTGEFWDNHPIRKSSKVEAVKLVIDNLKIKNLLSHKLIKHFLRLGFLLKEPAIITYILNQSNAPFFTKLKYTLGFWCYPIIKPILKLKGKILKN